MAEFPSAKSLRRVTPGYKLQDMCLAVPGKIISVQGEDPLERVGRIDFGGIVKEASLAYVPEAKVGDYAIVHVGFAISLVDEAEAAKVFEYLQEMEELAELHEGENPARLHDLQPERAP